MKRKSFAEMDCPIARSLEQAGEWWSMLILRDAFYGMRRFDEFERSLGISPSSLTRRLNSLVNAGLLARQQYSTRPPRLEYVLTERGRDFLPVLMALRAWGIKHERPERVQVRVVDSGTGQPIDPVVVDRNTGKQISSSTVSYIAGPDAREQLRVLLGRAK